MSLAYGDVRWWRAEPLGQAVDGIKADLDALEQSREELEGQGVPESWTGLAVFAARVRRDLLVARLGAHLRDKRTLRRALHDAEAQVAEIERLVLDAEGQAQAQQLAIGGDGSVTDQSTPPTFPTQAEADDWTRARRAQAQAVADLVTTILGRAAAVDATLAAAVPAAHDEVAGDYGTASPEVAQRWATMTDAERRAVIEELVEEHAAESGVEVPTIVWEDESWGPRGQWRDGDGEIALNEGILDDPQILHTVAHEMRHARQFEAMRDQDAWHWFWQEDPFDEHERDGISEDQAEEWERNYGDYQSTDSGDTYEEYFEQPVEVDARRSGKETLDSMTEEELERLLEEGQ